VLEKVEHPDLAVRLGIRETPTAVLLDNGGILAHAVGASAVLALLNGQSARSGASTDL